MEVAKAMKGSFFKYVEKTWPYVKKYFRYHYSSVIRENLMELVSIMMKSCSNDIQRERLFITILPDFVAEI